MKAFGTVMLTLVALLGPGTHAASAQGEKQARPEVLSRLIACRSVPEASMRLACYDTQSAALDQAERQRDVVVVDRNQIKKARRSLFGLELPDFSLFGGADKGNKGEGSQEEEEGVSRIESTIVQATQGPTGRWTLIIQGGARWQQIDTRDLARLPKATMPIVIRRATMGSFLASIDKQIAIRVRRIN